MPSTNIKNLFFLLFLIQNVISTKPPPPTESAETVEAEKQAQDSYYMYIILGLLLMTFLFGYVTRKNKIGFFREPAIAIVLGVLTGGLVHLRAKTYGSANPLLRTVGIETLQNFVLFDQEFFFLVLLPPIIFEAGFNMKRRDFFYNSGSITLYAILGTVISTITVGIMSYGATTLGWTGGDYSFIDCMIFGALISATDPVTVISVFKEVRVNNNLYANVFGESALNDAVAIVLYRLLYQFYEIPVSGWYLALSVLKFVMLFLASAGIGTSIALMAAALFKYTDFYLYPVAESAMIILYAYCSYLLAEGLKLSGIVAILFCGILMEYAIANMSMEGRRLSSEMMEVLSSISERVVFIFLGLALFSFREFYDWKFIGLSILIIFVSRAVHVFPISIGVNLTREKQHRLSWRDQFMLWFSGLRGAIAFALALNIPGDNAKRILTTTLMIVFFTVVFLGGLTVPLLGCLKIDLKGYRDELEIGQQEPQVPLHQFPKFMTNIDHFLRFHFTRQHVRPVSVQDDSGLVELGELGSQERADQERSVALDEFPMRGALDIRSQDDSEDDRDVGDGDGEDEDLAKEMGDRKLESEQQI